MAEAKVVQVLVEISHGKLMEFVDFVDRINGDVKKVDMHAEPVPGSLPETAAGALNLVCFIAIFFSFLFMARK
jgi:hypothetical protein